MAGDVGVDGRHDRARRGQSGQEPIEELDLGRAGLSGGAEVAGVAPLLRMELVMAERVDGALGDDERAIVRPRFALPGRLAPPGREAGERRGF